MSKKMKDICKDCDVGCNCDFSYENYCISPEECDKDLQDDDLVIPESLLLKEEE